MLYKLNVKGYCSKMNVTGDCPKTFYAIMTLYWQISIVGWCCKPVVGGSLWLVSN